MWLNTERLRKEAHSLEQKKSCESERSKGGKYGGNRGQLELQVFTMKNDYSVILKETLKISEGTVQQENPRRLGLFCIGA